MADRDPNFPDFENPPVIEVVCGVSFAPLQNFKAIHIGLFWECLKAQFPHVEEHPLLATVIELTHGVLPSPPEIQFVETPPLPRVWFLDKSGNGIIQVQRDTFIHNWRKLAPAEQYPRFQAVLGNFKSNFEVFRRFVEESSLGTITPVQCELTYINHISEGAFWSQGKPISELFPDFVWQNQHRRFLPSYDGANYRTSFRLPDDCGRLHVSIQTGFRRPTNDALVVLELKARGIGKDRSIDALWPWFDKAHEWIVKGFADVTSERAQKELWERKQ